MDRNLIDFSSTSKWLCWMALAVALLCAQRSYSLTSGDESWPPHPHHMVNHFRMHHHFTMNNSHPPPPPLVGNHCQNESHCGMDSVCWQNKCRCVLGYTWSNERFRCRQVNCTTDEDCLDSPHTTCRTNNACLCQDNYYVDWNSQTCRFSYISSLQIIERSIPIVVVFVAFLLFAAAIARCYYLRKRRITSTRALMGGHASSALRDGNNISTLLSENYYAYCDQLIASDTVNFPPPPPYVADCSPKDTSTDTSAPPPPYSESIP